MADLDRLQKFYLAYYGRPADVGGLDYWSKQMDGRLKGQDGALASAFGSIDQPEFRALYGNTPAVDLFVSAVYENLFGRPAEKAGIAYWEEVYRAYLIKDYSPDQIRAVMIARIIDGASGSDKLGLTNKTTLATALTSELKLKAAAMSTADLTTAKDFLSGTGGDSWLTSSLPLVAAKVKDISANDTAIEYLSNLAYSSLALPSMTAASASLSYSKNFLLEKSDNTGVFEDTITIILSGDTFKGDVGAVLGSVSSVPAGLTAKLLKTSATTALLSLTGKATAHAEANTVANLKVTFTDADFSGTAVQWIDGVVKDNIVVGFADVFFSETDGVLKSAAGQITGSVKIDLSTDQILLGTSKVRLMQGAMTAVTAVDLSDALSASAVAGASTVSVSFTGDSAANTYVASYLGDTIKGGGGADNLTAGAGLDKFIFASTAIDNGTDTIAKFVAGTGGDILNFSSFLTKTGTSKVAAKLSTAVDSTAWVSGDVLVVQGSGLATATAVANLFDSDGTGLLDTGVFATPTSNTKAVVITADLVGDARIWYLVKTGNISATLTNANIVQAEDLTLVAVLTGVNSFSLLPFVAANFA